MLRSLVFALAVAALAAADLPAQARIVGTVLDHATETPIPGSYVEIFDSAWRRVDGGTVDSLGVFRFTPRRPGRYYLRTRRVGYREVTTPAISTTGTAYLNVEIRLKSDAVLLAPLTVVAQTRRLEQSPVLRDFQSRANTGLGTYYSRDDIQRLRPGQVSDLVLRQPGFQSNTSGRRRVLTSSRSAALPYDCPVQIYVDGFLLNPPGMPADASLTLDEAVLPHDVEGIEIYRGLATVPAEFMSMNAQCAVVAVWTRRGPPS